MFGPWPGNPGGAGVWPGNAGGGQPVGAATAGTLVGPSAAANHGHPVLAVANRAALVSLSAAAMNDGTPCWVNTYGAWFDLQTSALATSADTVITASGAAGKQWLRREIPNRAFWAATTWFVNPSTGNNENSGVTALLPLASLAEWRRRVLRAQWAAGVTLTLQADIADADELVVDSDGSLTVQGTVTVLDTRTVSVAQARDPATNAANEVTMPVDWSAHVGRFVRVQGTTNYAMITRNVGGGGTIVRLSELWNTTTNAQVAAGGVTAGQILEVVTQTKGPLQVRKLGRLSMSMNDVRLDGAGATGLRETRDNTAGFYRRCIFAGTTFARQHPNGDIFICCGWRPTGATCNWLDGSDLLTGPAFIGCQITWNRRMKTRSLALQASTVVVAGTALHVDGDLGQFDLLAAEVGILLPSNDIGSKLHFNSGRHYGGGNNAAAWFWDVQAEAMVSYPTGTPPTNNAGLGVRINAGNVAIGALPVNLSLTNGSAVFAL